MSAIRLGDEREVVLPSGRTIRVVLVAAAHRPFAVNRLAAGRDPGRAAEERFTRPRA